MSASFTWPSSTVTTSGGEIAAKARILVRNGTAKALDRSGVSLLERQGVTAVRVDGNRTRTVEFDDGETWLVVRDKGCGCGGR